MSICGKIVLQMNAKIGQPIWSVPLQHPFWKNKLVMYGGLSVIKNVKQDKKNNTSKRVEE